MFLMRKATNVQYKFISNGKVKHSSYNYQKLFRALYGYTQNVTKSNGKTYTYSRKGILTDLPYIKTGKNSVIIPETHKDSVVQFFETGKNPAHYWKSKGNWKAIYYLEDKILSGTEITVAVENQIKRTYLEDPAGNNEKIDKLVNYYSENKKSLQEFHNIKNILLQKIEKVRGHSWYNIALSSSDAVKEFEDNYKKLTQF